MHQQFDLEGATKLNNAAAVTTAAQRQKELLKGRYEITVNQGMPYQKKVIRMASEPVAYQMYK